MRVRAPSVIRFDRETLLSEVVITNLRENEFCLWAILYIKTKIYTGTEGNTVGVLPWSRFKIQHVLSLLFLFGQYGSRETPYPMAGRHQHRNWSTSARLTFSLRRTFDKWKHYSSVNVTIRWPLPKGFPARGPLKPHWWAVEPPWRLRTQPCQHRPYWCFLNRLPFRSECWSSAIWSSLVPLHSASLFFYESDGIAESEILSARIVSRTSKRRPKVVTKT